MTARLSINIRDDTDKALKDLADRGEMSVTEIVNRSVAVYSYLAEELAVSPADVMIAVGRLVSEAQGRA